MAREMPRLRPLDPILRSAGAKRVFSVQLPKEPPVDPTLKIAAFDGGIPKKSELSPWAEPREPSDVGAAVPDYMDHGFGVTSALLFGGLVEKQPVRRFDSEARYRCECMAREHCSRQTFQGGKVVLIQLVVVE